MKTLPWYILVLITVSSIIGQISVEIETQPDGNRIQIERHDRLLQ
jgi:hypothetical protein